VILSEQPSEPDMQSITVPTVSISDPSAIEAQLNDIRDQIWEPGEKSLPNQTLSDIKDQATATPPDFPGAFASALDLLQQGQAEIQAGEEALLLELADLLTQYFEALGGFDAGLCMIFPGTSDDCTTQKDSAGIFVPAGALNQTTVFTITRIAGGCLYTDNPQSNECYNYTAIPDVPFNFPVTLGECIDPGFVRAGQEGLIRLGAQDDDVIDPTTGQPRVQTLPPPDDPQNDLDFLACQPAIIAGADAPDGLFQFAQRGWDRVKSGVSQLLTPAPLHANVALALSTGYGGKKGSLSDVAGILPSQMSIHQGDGQTGPIGSEAPIDPAVSVTDVNGDPVWGASIHFRVLSGGGAVVPMASIHFRVLSGGGAVVPMTVTSDINGVAQVTSWTLGASPGLNVLEAWARGIADPADAAESYNGGVFQDPDFAVPHEIGKLQFNADGVIPGGGELIILNDVDVFNQTGTLNPNNRMLVDNLVDFYNSQRGSQTTVWFDRGRGSKCFETSGCLDPDLVTMTSVITAAGLTRVDNNSDSKNRYDVIPANVSSIILWNPTVAFQKGEIAAFSTFLAEGGRLMLIGEEKDFVGANGIRAANRLIADLGGTWDVNGDNVDCGGTVLPAASINTAHPIMRGITGLSMNCSASTSQSTTSADRLFNSSANDKVLGGVAVDLLP
jgi:hypothetical protein